MSKNLIDDGFKAYLVQEAEFDGEWEIPVIYADEEINVPKDIIPFDKRNVVKDKKEKFVHFYMHDSTFRQVLTATKRYLPEMKEFGGVISPDCSLYIDMPLILQATNTYMNRAVGFYFQRNGIKVIPNVRWGDERSYKFCFLGLEKNSIYSVSNHGCFKSNEEKEYFRKGFREMVKVLEPKTILVHGDMTDSVFNEFPEIELVNYKSWIERVKGKRGLDGNK